MSYLNYLLMRLITFPLSLLPYAQLHKVGRFLGVCAYFICPRFRKRALSNLALASTLALNEQEIVQTAKEAFANLMITCLEYAKFAREKNIARVATCVNPETADKLMSEGKGVIFFCAHQANWEILFLEGTSRMPGVAIGRPIKNKFLYQWVLKMREKFGGTIITPKNAFREGMRALKRGAFLGIVGDQGMPDSGFSSTFLGRRAWTSPMPAILAYRSGRPILFACTKRLQGKYQIHYSEPLWPDLSQPMEKEIERLMLACLKLLEESIRERPGEWLWQHNRFKQQLPGKVKHAFRHDSLAIVLPEEPAKFEESVKALPILRTIYPLEFITLFVPAKFLGRQLIEDAETIYYSSAEDLRVRDFRFKLVFNLSSHKHLRRHFRSLAAFDVVDLHPNFFETCLTTASS